LAVTALVAAVGIWWVFRPPSGPVEPTYDDVPLSAWLSLYGATVQSAASGGKTSIISFTATTAKGTKTYAINGTNSPAPKALEAIGRDAIPFLIQKLQRPDVPESVYSQHYVELVRKAPGWLGKVLGWIWYPPSPASADRLEAATALRLPVFQTPETVPLLINALKDSDAEVRAAAGKTLRIIDPEAADKAGVK